MCRQLYLLLSVTAQLAFAAFHFVGPASADYLEVRRAVSIKEQPQRNSRDIESPAVGTKLQLLDDGRQSRGYYQTLAPSSNRSGWIYRSFVRRYPGVHPDIVRNSRGTTDGPDLPADSVVKVHFIDVDQGDAALVEFPCGAVLIDAGGQNNQTTTELSTYLKRLFDRRPDLEQTIDTVFITHTHIDHNRALRTIVEDPEITINNYVHNGEYSGSGRDAARWMRDNANSDGRQVNDRIVSQSEILPLPRTSGLADEAIDPIDCDGVDPQIRVLAGPYEENPGWAYGEFEDGNNKSLVIRIDFGEASFLFTGDLEEAAIETLVEYYDGTVLLDVNVYQAGHHGSHNGTTDTLMRTMTPDAAVISMGPAADRRPWTAWQYGHPRRTVVEMLDKWIDRPRSKHSWVRVASGMRNFFDYEMRDAVYGTGWDGTIVISADVSGNMRVETLGQPGPS